MMLFGNYLDWFADINVSKTEPVHVPYSPISSLCLFMVWRVPCAYNIVLMGVNIRPDLESRVLCLFSCKYFSIKIKRSVQLFNALDLDKNGYIDFRSVWSITHHHSHIIGSTESSCLVSTSPLNPRAKRSGGPSDSTTFLRTVSFRGLRLNRSDKSYLSSN